MPGQYAKCLVWDLVDDLLGAYSQPHNAAVAAPGKGSSRQKIKPARPGERIILGGDAALQSPAKPMPWKKRLLWAVLVAGSGLLACMTRSLPKEMRTDEEKRVPED